MEKLLPRVPEEPLRLPVHEHDAAAPVHDDHGVRRGFEKTSELLLRTTALGNVASHLSITAENAALVTNRRDDDVRPETRTVLADAPTFLLESSLGLRNAQLHVGFPGGDVLGCVEAGEMLAEDFLRPVALDALGTGVPAGDAPLRIEHEDRVVLDAFHHEAKAFLALHRLFV